MVTSFISTWSVAEDGESITLPLREGFAYGFTVDWGDGSEPSEVTAHDDTDITHTYAAAGQYTVTIDGLMETLHFDNGGDKDKILEISNLGHVGWTSFDSAFEGCSQLVVVLGGDTSGVTTMAFMFNLASNVSPDTSTWDTSSVTNMAFMFQSATSANPDTSGWNVDKVENMYRMFRNASSAVPDMSEWSLSAIISMGDIVQRNEYWNRGL